MRCEFVRSTFCTRFLYNFTLTDPPPTKVLDLSKRVGVNHDIEFIKVYRSQDTTALSCGKATSFLGSLLKSRQRNFPQMEIQMN